MNIIIIIFNIFYYKTIKISNIKINSSNKIANKSIIPNLKTKDKYFTPSNLEWYNSVFNYNVNNIKHLPNSDKISQQLIDTYLNMYNKKIERKIGLRKLPDAIRWNSSRKNLINKITLKHTNNKVIINVMVYDRIFNNISKKIMRIMKFYKYKIEHYKKLTSINFNLLKLKNNIKSLLLLSFINNSYKDAEELNLESVNKYNELISDINNDKVSLLKKSIKRRKSLVYHLKFMENYILRYKTQFIVMLQGILKKLYKKEVIINIILLKNYFLSSDILTKILAYKSKNRKNSTFRLFRRTLVNVKPPIFNKATSNIVKREKFNQSIIINDKLYYDKRKEFIKLYKDNSKEVLCNLDNKTIIGIRIEAAGRLTKRYSAQRSVRGIRYKGTLKNVNSSMKGLSTQMVRNNISQSTQYSKAQSYSRIGSFGIKGWINSM